MSAPTYNRMGLNYTDFRQPEPRIEAALWAALGDARSVVNVGAGAGSYEPPDREVVAVEPSPVMIAQRPPNAAPALEGIAESLPLDDKSVDAAMGVLTIHHWLNLEAGLAEMRRVSRRRIVLLTLDAEATSDTWLIKDYFPEAGSMDRDVMPSQARLSSQPARRQCRADCDPPRVPRRLHDRPLGPPRVAARSRSSPRQLDLAPDAGRRR
jgi:SAM-dependent methyltransferase